MTQGGFQEGEEDLNTTETVDNVPGVKCPPWCGQGVTIVTCSPTWSQVGADEV